MKKSNRGRQETGNDRPIHLALQASYRTEAAIGGTLDLA